MGLDGYISCQELRASLPNALPNYVMGYTLMDEGQTAQGLPGRQALPRLPLGQQLQRPGEPQGIRLVPGQTLIREYFQAAYGEEWERVLAYLSELSRLSSCDYLNGKGSRTNPDIARRMREAQAICRDFAPVLDACREDGLYWRLLAWHKAYALGLARALELLAEGEAGESPAA